MKKTRGITLIALVVTIIVLLILAGISINMINSNNGILNHTADAKIASEIAQEKHILETAILKTMQKDRFGNVSVDGLTTALKNSAEVELIRKKIVVTFPSERSYEVDYDGNILDYRKIDVASLSIMSNTKFRNSISTYKGNIISVKVLNSLNPPENPSEIFDVSSNSDGTIKAWLIENTENEGYYDLFIGGKDGVRIDSCSQTFKDFSNCISMDLENLYTSDAESMNAMFQDCKSIESIDVTNFDTKKVEDMGNMFSGCKKIYTLDLRNFNTENVWNMGGMFKESDNLTSIDLSNFVTNNVKKMGTMFLNCRKLKNINLSNFNTSKVESMYRMFINCNSLTTLDLNTFTMDSCTNIEGMFFGCSNLININLKNSIYTDKITNNLYLFSQTPRLITIVVSSDSTIANGQKEYLTARRQESGLSAPTYINN